MRPGAFTTILLAADVHDGVVARRAQELRRATVWDLKLGQPVSAQPASSEFRGFACGSNGGRRA